MALGIQSLKRLTAFLYDLVISRFLTITSHLLMLPHMAKLSGSFLDVGSGTGAPLQTIINNLKESYSKIVGVDMHHEYTLEAQRRFASDPDVTIYEMNFYDIKKQLNEKFNFIFFSFSFMLMPDQVAAINTAKSCLENDGRIAFLMTINPKENPIVRKLKPLIYKLTSIDFGNQTYQSQFEEVLKIGKL